jgi:hypothetical protein
MNKIFRKMKKNGFPKKGGVICQVAIGQVHWARVRGQEEVPDIVPGIVFRDI